MFVVTVEAVSSALGEVVPTAVDVGGELDMTTDGSSRGTASFNIIGIEKKKRRALVKAKEFGQKRCEGGMSSRVSESEWRTTGRNKGGTKIKSPLCFLGTGIQGEKRGTQYGWDVCRKS